MEPSKFSQYKIIPLAESAKQFCLGKKGARRWKNQTWKGSQVDGGGRCWFGLER